MKRARSVGFDDLRNNLVRDPSQVYASFAVVLGSHRLDSGLLRRRSSGRRKKILPFAP
jgi:hypothetical protein